MRKYRLGVFPVAGRPRFFGFDSGFDLGLGLVFMPESYGHPLKFVNPSVCLRPVIRGQTPGEKGMMEVVEMVNQMKKVPLSVSSKESMVAVRRSLFKRLESMRAWRLACHTDVLQPVDGRHGRGALKDARLADYDQWRWHKRPAPSPIPKRSRLFLDSR